MKRGAIRLTVLLWGILSGCAGGVTTQLSPPVPAAQQDDLHRAAHDYYSAQTPDDLFEAVKTAEAINSRSAIYHELAADLAYLMGDKTTQFDHLLNGILAPDNQVADIHLHMLYEMGWSYDETRRAEAVFQYLSDAHPLAAVRSLAAHYTSLLYRRREQLKQAQDSRRRIGVSLPFAVIGTWGNKQGKGFDLVYPPETEIDFDATYQGKTVDVAWRTDVTRSGQAHYDLTQSMFPNTEAVAYALSAVKASQAGMYELRLTSSDGVKVWINQQLVFSERRIRGRNWDTLVIPVELDTGTNRILIKTIQDDGSWDLYGRMTLPRGESIPEGTVVAVTPNAPIDAAKTETQSSPITVAQIISNAVSQLRVGSARRDFFAIEYASRLGVQVARTQLADLMVHRHENSLRGRLELVFALWDSQERGRASELMTQLVADTDQRLPLVALKQIRFWWQSDLEKNAREATLALAKQYPDNYGVALGMVTLFAKEGWKEDQCHALEDINRRWPGEVDVMYQLANCYADVGYPSRQRDLLGDIFAAFPGDYTMLSRWFKYAKEGFRMREAARLLNRMIDAWPERPALRYALSSIEKDRGNSDRAAQLLREAQLLNPHAPDAYAELASMRYFEGYPQEAIGLWRQALTRNPDNGALAERLAYLDPGDLGPWSVDIPDDVQIDRAVALRDTMTFDEAADTAMLMDHCVTDLQPDGSAINVTTTIVHALNVSGSDAITEFQVPCFGYARILQAYALDAAGRRREPTSIRGRTIRFRQIEPGSTVVVQNRCEESADDMVGDFFSYRWFFQALSSHFVDSRYILWAPPGIQINEFVRGDIDKEESIQYGHRRISWHGTNTPVMKEEVAMPPAPDVIWMLLVSTVPDWDVFLQWEKALLQDAFRVSPDVEAVASRLFAGATTPAEKAMAIHRYLIDEIRYQQDYENHVAGVKPHTASQVIARGYGDCKDKSVLFITLATLAGIDARFSLVRTRDWGQIKKEVPSQQFNHAIVYIPAQEGFPDGVFFDATADALDLDVLRNDNPGTWAMVLDTENDRFDWIEVPFQAPAKNLGKERLQVDLSASGDATGTIDFFFKGRLGSVLRQASRNAEKFQKIIQIVTDAIIKGAVVTSTSDTADIDNIDRPVTFSIGFESDAFSRVNGNTLKFRIPLDADPEQLFALESRDHPLVLGVPNASEWDMSFALPRGATVTHLPPTVDIDTECVEYHRTVETTAPRQIRVTQRLTYLCDRILPEQYPAYRQEIQKLRMASEEDVVITLE